MRGDGVLQVRARPAKAEILLRVGAEDIERAVVRDGAHALQNIVAAFRRGKLRRAFRPAGSGVAEGGVIHPADGVMPAVVAYQYHAVVVHD